MSLISDALKRAHVEAANQDRTRYRDYMNNAGRVAAGFSMSPAMMVLAAVLGGCVTAGAGLVYLTRTARVPAPPAREGRVEAAAQKPAAVPAPAIASPTPAVNSPAPPPRLVEKKNVEKNVEKKAATPRPKPRPAVAAAPPARGARDGFVEGETYASPVAGPLGAELKLTGISSTRGDSVAIVNGTLLRAGAAAGPFIVEEIEPRRIRVRYVDVRFWVTY